MDTVMERLGLAIGAFVEFLASSGALFLIFALIWAAVGAGLIWSQGSVIGAWEWVRGLPLLAQIVIWLIFLPVMAGLWVWETTWPTLVRLAILGALAGWSLYIFFPRALMLAR